MRRIVGTTCLVLLAIGAAPKLWAQPATKSAPAKAATRPADRSAREADDKAIRASAEAFADAYNAHDAKALAALFAADGEIVDELGDAKQGRAAIEQIFAAVFEQFPDAAMAIAVKSVRFVGANLAIEDGVASVAREEGDAVDNSYTVVHVKQDGKWQMASVRDLTAQPAEASTELAALEGLIGEWVDESPDSLIVTSYRWGENKTCILSDFVLKVAGQDVMNGTQRIGWDPVTETIRSWIFDSEGGFAEGRYAQDGNRWVIKLTGVNRDGETATATNTITILSKDQMTWQSRDRTIGSRVVPDTQEVVVVRPPPSPQ